MSEKPIAFLVTAVAVAPLCAVCILGPAALGAVATGLAGWIGGLGPITTTGTAVGAAAVVYGVVRWNRARAIAKSRGLVSQQRKARPPERLT